MDPNEAATLLLLESKGDRLSVTARQHVVPGQDQTWFDVEFTAVGHPFAGVVTDVVTANDLEFWRHNVGRLAAPGEVVLGGSELQNWFFAWKPRPAVNRDRGRCRSR